MADSRHDWPHDGTSDWAELTQPACALTTGARAAARRLLKRLEAFIVVMRWFSGEVTGSGARREEKRWR